MPFGLFAALFFLSGDADFGVEVNRKQREMVCEIMLMRLNCTWLLEWLIFI
jgi:hypothetical protein